MKGKIFLFVFLSGAVLGIGFFFTRHTRLRLLPFAAVGPCDGYTITRGRKTTTLARSGERWITDKVYPSNTDAIKELETAFHAVATDDPVSDNPENYPVFRVDGDVIVCSRAGKEYRLFVGKNADARHSYIRAGNDPAVYISSLLDGVLYQDYRDKNLYLINDETAVSELRLSFGGTSVVFARTENGWTRNTVPVTDANVSTLLGIIRNLKATDMEVAETPPRYPAFLVAVAGTKTTTVSIAEHAPEVFVLYRDDSPFLYLVPGQTLDPLFAEIRK